MSDGTNSIVVIILIALSAWGIYRIWPKPEVWTGIVYPDASNLLIFERVGDFASLDTCLTTAITKVNSFAAPNSADYECGLNCKPSDFDPDRMICEETRN